MNAVKPRSPFARRSIIAFLLLAAGIVGFSGVQYISRGPAYLGSPLEDWQDLIRAKGSIAKQKSWPRQLREKVGSWLGGKPPVLQWENLYEEVKVDILESLLDDPDPLVRLQIVRELDGGLINLDEFDWNRWIRLFEDADSNVRVAALNTISVQEGAARTAKRSYCEYLLSAIEAGDAIAYDRLASALSLLGPEAKQYRDRLLPLLNSPKDEVVKSAMLASLRADCADEVNRFIEQRLFDVEKNMALGTLMLISEEIRSGFSPSPAAVERIAERLRAPGFMSAEIQFRFISGAADHAPLMDELWGRADVELRKLIVRADQSGSPERSERILRALEDTEGEVQVAASESLLRYLKEGRRLKPAQGRRVINLLETSNLTMQENLLLALSDIEKHGLPIASVDQLVRLTAKLRGRSRGLAVETLCAAAPDRREVLDLAIKALEDANPAIRVSGLKALRHLPQEALKVRKRIEELYEDPLCQPSAYAALLAMGPPIRPMLPKLLREMPNIKHDRWHRSELQAFLPFSKEELKILRTNASQKVFEQFHWLLRTQQGPEVLDVLLEPFLVEIKTVHLLERINDVVSTASAQPRHVQRTLDAHRRKAISKMQTCKVLGAIGFADPNEALAFLLKQTEDQDTDVPSAAMEAIGRLGEHGKPAIPRLRKLAETANRYEKPVAVDALYRIDPSAAKPYLRAALASRFHALHLHAHRTLQRRNIVPAEFADTLVNDLFKQRRRSHELYPVIAKLENVKEITPKIIAKLKETPWEQSEPLLACLEAIGSDGKEAAPTIREGLRLQPNLYAVLALVAIDPDDETSLDSILRVCDESTDLELRATAFQSLAAYRGHVPKMLPHLRKILATPMSSVRLLQPCIFTVQAIGPPAAELAPILRQLQLHSEDTIQRNARDALHAVDEKETAQSP